MRAALDWFVALGAQLASLPYDAASPTRISDNFLVEVMALTFAYLLGAYAQRRRDIRQGKRGVASDIVRDLRELKDASSAPKDLRPAEKVRASSRLFATIDLARDRIRMTEGDLAHLEAVRRAVAAYAGAWSQTKFVRENEAAAWKAMVAGVERRLGSFLRERKWLRGRFDDIRDLREFACEPAAAGPAPGK